MATTTNVDLDDTWLNGQSAAGATDQISDPFAIVTDHAKRPRTDTPGSQLSTPSNNIHTSNSEGENSHGISSGPSQQEQSNQAAANSFANTRSLSNNQPRAGSHIDTIGSDPAEALQMPVRMNPHENGLRRSPRLREQKENEISNKRKAHTAYGTSALTKVALGLFLLVALASTIKMPEHKLNPNATYTEQVMKRFHEVNELCDGTLDEVHHLLYHTDISTNESFTFRNAMKQDDKLEFVDTMEKEISDYEKGKHWSIVHRDTLPHKA